MKITLASKKELVINKLPLKKYVDLLKSLQELPKHLGALQGLTNEEIFAKLPDLVANALPDVVRVICVATDLTEDEVYEMGLDEVVNVFLGIIEENKYVDVYNKIKKAVAQPKVQ
jgi:uncharacterized radical SAM superfamily protein